jgi:restriction system protein
MNEQLAHHYPPDLSTLLIEAIPRLVRSKPDVINLFRACGCLQDVYGSMERKLRRDRDSVTKFDIVRDILLRLNSGGDQYLAARREVLRRVTQWDDFTTCYDNQRVAAEGYVAKIQKMVNVKDSFTRINLEREAATRANREQKECEARERQQAQEERDRIKADLFSLFSMTDTTRRGIALEGVLNRLFNAHGLLIRESFRRIEPGVGVIEQIDGVIEFDNNVYLVEMKWWSEPLGPGEVSQHLVRVFNRGAARGLLLSQSGYTPAAVEICRDSLQRSVFVLGTLEEIVLLLERQTPVVDWLRHKVRVAIVDKVPFVQPLKAGVL